MGISTSRRRPSAWFFGLMGVAVIIGFAIGTYAVWSNDSALAERGRKATARVVDTHKNDEVEFRTPDGTPVRAAIGPSITGPEVRVGEEIEIIYDPADPSSDVEDARAPDDRSFAYLLLGITVLAVVGVPLATLRLARTSGRTPSP
ncbi:DUF3592 domain-containing protein [Actinosynnema sp. NPDC023587]|uniref:DUF3592 domain-containing protein n=1 Tax=Actinosynnema sp. NPDC023587 TaxID=3154695 RepID=UPI0033E3DC40